MTQNLPSLRPKRALATPNPALKPNRLHLIHHWIDRYYGITAADVLNGGQPGGSVVDGGALASEAFRRMRAMQTTAIDIERSRVDYARLRGSDAYAEYRDFTRLLGGFDPATLGSNEERLAFWLNLYNALILDATIAYDVSETVNEVRGFFWRAAYVVGGRRYSSIEIENGILRGNATHPAIPVPPFLRGDPRLAFAILPRDPRVHFAMNCASRSCPPIHFYDPARVDAQLDLATRSFINGGGVEIDRARGQVLLSRIFQWYSPDFGGGPMAILGRRAVLAFIARYLMDEADRAYLARPGLRVSFDPYDWSLNAA